MSNPQKHQDPTSKVEYPEMVCPVCRGNGRLQEACDAGSRSCCGTCHGKGKLTPPNSNLNESVQPNGDMRLTD